MIPLITTTEAIILGIASVIVLLALTYAARHYHISKYRKRYSAAHEALSNAINSVQSTLARLQANPHSLVSGDAKFVNGSAQQLEAARKLWTKFQSDHGNASSRRLQAETGLNQIDRRPVGLQHLRNLKKTIALLTEGLDADAPISEAGKALIQTSAAAAAELKRFEDAIAAKAQKAVALKQESTQLEVLLSEAHKRDLRHPTLQANFDKIVRLIGELEEKFSADPLDAHVKPIRYVEAKQRELGKILTAALDLHGAASSQLARANALHERVGALKSAALESCLEELPAFGSGHSFDEQGYVLQDSLDKLARLQEAMLAALQDRRILSFTKELASYMAQLERVEALIDTVLADKQSVDSAIKYVYGENSTRNDIAADKTLRKSIAESYAAQRFHEAALAADELRRHHDVRVQAREEIGKVAYPLDTVVQLMRNYKDVVSAELDHKFQLLVVDLRELGSKAKKGKADWAALTARAAELTELLVGEQADSIQRLANAEIAANVAAKEMVAVLREQFLFLDQHLAWAGLAEASSSKTAEASSVLASASIGKQDWNALRARADAANVGLLEVRAVLDPILAEHEIHRQNLETLQNQLEACAAPKAYARDICGTTFGASLICQVGKASSNVGTLSGHLHQRNYVALAAGIAESQAILKRENLETWWYCLQLMANSGVAPAVSFAMKEGFAVGEFQSWLQEKLDLSGTELYQPKQFQSSKSDDAGSLNVARRHADPPPASDYKAGKPQTTETPATS